LVLLPPLNLLTGTCRWSAIAVVAAAPAMGVRGLSGVREITELGWELMSTCQTKPQVARRYTLYRGRLFIVKTIVMKKVKKAEKTEILVDSCCEKSDSRQSWLDSFMKKA
jgi:hypothetical protein